LAYEEAIRQRREGDKKLKINDAEKEDNDESISEAKQNTALEALMKILEKYPNPQEYQDLQFLFFKIEQGEPVIISGIEDLVIHDGLATIFKLFRMQKVKQEDNDIGYVKSRATPNLLQFFEKGVSNLPKVEPPKEEEKKPLQKGPVLPGYAERAAYLQTMKEPDTTETDETLDDDGKSFGPIVPERATTKELEEIERVTDLREREQFIKAITAEQEALQEKREEWMTELPPEMKLNAAPDADFRGRTFSAKPKAARGDTSGWTDTPLQKQEKALLRVNEDVELPEDLLELAGEKKKKRGREPPVDSKNATPEAAKNYGLKLKEQTKKHTKQQMDGAKSMMELHKEGAFKKQKSQGDNEEEPLPFVWDREKAFKLPGPKSKNRGNSKLLEASALVGRFGDQSML